MRHGQGSAHGASRIYGALICLEPSLLEEEMEELLISQREVEDLTEALRQDECQA